MIIKDSSNRFRDIIVSDPRGGRAVLDMGAFAGFEGLVLGDYGYTPSSGLNSDPVGTAATEPSPSTSGASNTAGSTDWGSIFTSAFQAVAGVANLTSKIVAGQQDSSGHVYSQAEADAYNAQLARQQGNSNSWMSPLMLAGIAVIGIGGVLLFMKGRKGKSVLAGYGKRRRSRR